MIPQSIQKKMVAAALAAPSLKKEERNERAEFNFVGIDKFYSDVAIVMHELGLGWATVEEGIELIPLSDQVIVLQKFRFDVFDSESGDVAEGYSHLTIPAPFADAQTAGISLSYADKAFLRSALKIVTGEKDADHFAKKRDKPAAKPSPEKAAADLDPGPPEKAEKPKAEKKNAEKPKAKGEDKPDAVEEKKPEKAVSEQSEIEAISDRLTELLTDIGREKAGAAGIDALDKFRNDEASDISKLKAASSKEDADEDVKLWASKVTDKFRKLYDKFEAQVEEEGD